MVELGWNMAFTRWSFIGLKVDLEQYDKEYKYFIKVNNQDIYNSTKEKF